MNKDHMDPEELELASKALDVAVACSRRRIMEALLSQVKVGASDWGTVDEVLNALTRALVGMYTGQLASMMEAMSNAGLVPDLATRKSMLDSQIEATALSSLLMAHFDVSQANGRAINDAHLHFDRVMRCAEAEQTIVLAEIYPMGSPAEGSKGGKPN